VKLIDYEQTIIDGNVAEIFAPTFVKEATRFVPTNCGHLKSARKKLERQRMYLGDLPRELDHPLWTELLTQSPFELKDDEITSLKSYLFRPTPSDQCGPQDADDFTAFPLQRYFRCLDAVPSASVETSIYCTRSAGLPDAINRKDINAYKAAIDDSNKIAAGFLETTAPGLRISFELAQTIALYTIKEPFSICDVMNAALNCPKRDPDVLKYFYPYMKLLITALRAWEAIGNTSTVKVAFRGVKIKYNTTLQWKYNNYKENFVKGTKLTMGGFTSVSVSKKVALSFCDKILYVLKDVKGVNVSRLSAFPYEREILLPGPSVFKVLSSRLDKATGLLTVALTQVDDDEATYLSKAGVNNGVMGGGGGGGGGGGSGGLGSGGGGSGGGSDDCGGGGCGIGGDNVGEGGASVSGVSGEGGCDHFGSGASAAYEHDLKPENNSLAQNVDIPHEGVAENDNNSRIDYLCQVSVLQNCCSACHQTGI
jgi:hypothetical protein